MPNAFYLAAGCSFSVSVTGATLQKIKLNNTIRVKSRSSIYRLCYFII